MTTYLTFPFLIHLHQLTASTTPAQSKPESNGNEVVILRTVASPSDAVESHTKDTPFLRVSYPHPEEDTVSVF